MTKFFRAHPDALLILLASLLSVFLISYFVWGVQFVITNVNRGLKFVPQVQTVGFDLDAAAKLNLRGLKVQ